MHISYFVDLPPLWGSWVCLITLLDVSGTMLICGGVAVQAVRSVADKAVTVVFQVI